MSIIIPANSAVSGGFGVANSLMLNNPGDTAYLSRSNSSGTSTKKGTISVWVKGGEEPSGNNQTTLASWGDANNHGALLWNGSDKIDAFDYQSGYASQLQTSAVLRDSSAWYHIVYSWDTTLSTANDRQKVYINGVEQTYSTRTNYSQDAATSWNANSYSVRVGALNSSSYFRGYMSEVVFIDGQQLAPTSFGEFDEDSEIWKPIDVSGLTFGTNGAYLDFEDSSNLGNDANGGTDFSETNLAATDQATDTCTNNFATLNPLSIWGGSTATSSTFLSEGNTKFDTGTNSAKGVVNTSIGVSSGKWYCELKTLETDRMWIGIINKQFFTSTTNNFWTTGLSSGFFWYGNGTAVYNSNDDSYSTYGGYTDNDVVMFALDMDNYAWYLGKNGTWLNSGNPESGATKTGSVTEETYFGTATLTDYGEVFFMVGDSSAAGTANTQWNFGNPFFSISSGNTDGNGYGDFEYTVPSGYFALNSKNLAEYGG